MDPQHGAPDPGAPQKSDTEAPHREWGEWFTSEFQQRAERNTTMVKRLDAVGANGRYTSSDITMWKGGKKRPSEAGAMYVAAAWGLDAALVVRKAAGGDRNYLDFADFLDGRTGDTPPLASIRLDGALESDQHDLAHDLALVEELIALRLEKLRRALGEPPPHVREDAS